MQVPLDFTYVLYDDSSTMAEFMAYLTFLPVILPLVLFCFFLARRDIETGYIGAGTICNLVLNFVLKKLLQGPRPIGSAKTGFGMPSNHSQIMWFLGTYYVFWTLSSRAARGAPVLTAFKVVPVVVAGVLVPVSRTLLGVHSVPQVVVGSVVGFAFALVWYAGASLLGRRCVFPLIEGWPISKWFYLKDLSNLDSPLQVEYQHLMKLKGLDYKS